MALQDRFSSAPKFNRLASAAADLGYEIVDIAGFLDLVEEHAQAQTQGLKVLRGRAKDMEQANADVREAVKEMAGSTTQTARDVESSAALVRTTGEKTRNVANWVQDTESFLLQVYRRDMGGGEFKMMKDLSAPIFIKGQHWGGLRLAYSIS